MTFSTTIRLRLALLVLGTSFLLAVGVWWLLRDKIEEGLHIEGETVLQSLAGSLAWHMEVRGNPGWLEDMCALLGKGRLEALRIEVLRDGTTLFDGGRCPDRASHASGGILEIVHVEAMPGIGQVRFAAGLSTLELEGLAREVAEFALWTILAMIGVGWVATSVFGRMLRRELVRFGLRDSDPGRGGWVDLAEVKDLHLLDSIVRSAAEESVPAEPPCFDVLDVPLDDGGILRLQRVVLGERDPGTFLVPLVAEDGLRVACASSGFDTSRLRDVIDGARSSDSACPIPPAGTGCRIDCPEGTRLLVVHIPSSRSRP